MDAALYTGASLHHLAESLGELDFLPMQVLTRQLRKCIDLLLQCLVQAAVFVAEVDGGIPHLQIEIRRVIVVEEIAAVAAGENLGRVCVMNSVAVRTVSAVFFEQLLDGQRARFCCQYVLL